MLLSRTHVPAFQEEWNEPLLLVDVVAQLVDIEHTLLYNPIDQDVLDESPKNVPNPTHA
jgi:hypothetical protein